METMLRAANGGSVASFSPTGLGIATGHDELERGFFKAVFQQGATRLGLAALAGKVALYNAGHDYDLLETFTIFGDPALKLPTYALTLTPESSAKFGSRNMTIVHTVYVTNTGWLTNTALMSFAGQTWPITYTPTNLTILPGQSVALVVSVTIPTTAVLGETDVTTLTLRSPDNLPLATIPIATTIPYQIALPLVRKN
jgi:hypothetical protein